MDPLAVARRGFASLPTPVTKRAFRGDSACYQDALLKALAAERIAVTISADLTQALRHVSPKQGQLFDQGSKHLAVVSNRWELEAPALVRWHWGKAGTIEFVHDVTKNDLAAGVPPAEVRGERRLGPG